MISFQLHAILSSVMKSRAVRLHAAQDMNHPSVQHNHLYIPRPLITQQLSQLLDQLSEREIPYLHNFCYSTLLQLFYFIVINLLLCLIDKLNFIIDIYIHIYVYMKNKVYIEFSTTYGLEHPLGLRMYSPRIRRNCSNRLKQ